ncbi:MAG: hypothetical protein ACYC96_09220 [Fimbriimonadaceae bacterium]
MGRAGRFLLVGVVLAFGAGAIASAIPEVLIVQRRVEKTHAGDPNLEIGDYVAQEFADDGRVSPIYWSMNDAIFRSMLQTGKVASADTPSLATALAVAKSLKVAYVFIVESHTDKNGAVLCRAELYKDSETPTWIDPADGDKGDAALMKRLVRSGRLSQLDADKLTEARGYRTYSVGSSGALDTDNTLRSIARTWVQVLDSGPFSALPSRPQQAPPDPIAGPLAHLQVTQPQIPKAVDNAQVFKDVDAAVTDGHQDVAILILRDAVDAQPFDLPRRQALIKLLNDTGHPDLAASEAARAATLNPGVDGFRLEDARAQLAAGNLDGAANSAKSALAHDPKTADGHVVLGEVNLFRFQFAGAINEFDAACAIGPTTEAVYFRAIAKALTGDVAGSATDCESAHHGSVVQPIPSYDTTMKVFDGGVQMAFDDVRNLLPNAALGTNSQELAKALTKTQNAATASAAFLSSWQPLKNHAPSHERRILALKLLAQACGEVVDYLGKRDDEELTDARIDLGEAMKQYKAARQLFVDEAAG